MQRRSKNKITLRALSYSDWALNFTEFLGNLRKLALELFSDRRKPINSSRKSNFLFYKKKKSVVWFLH